MNNVKIKKSDYIKYIGAGIAATVLFVFMAQISQVYNADLQALVTSAGVFAPLMYMLINALAIVVAPISSGFLVPVAANAFGPFEAALYSIIGWFIGSVIAFYLARRYGHGKLQGMQVCKKIQTIEQDMSERQTYILILLLRMALPVDVLSYVLGLFTSISYKTFIWTTLIGIAPFAFLFAYSSVLSVWAQVAVSALGTVSLLLVLYFLITYKSKDK